jgi:hypothetical protein
VETAYRRKTGSTAVSRQASFHVVAGERLLLSERVMLPFDPWENLLLRFRHLLHLRRRKGVLVSLRRPHRHRINHRYRDRPILLFEERAVVTVIDVLIVQSFAQMDLLLRLMHSRIIKGRHRHPTQSLCYNLPMLLRLPPQHHTDRMRALKLDQVIFLRAILTNFVDRRRNEVGPYLPVDVEADHHHLEFDQPLARPVLLVLRPPRNHQPFL